LIIISGAKLQPHNRLGIKEFCEGLKIYENP